MNPRIVVATYTTSEGHILEVSASENKVLEYWDNDETAERVTLIFKKRDRPVITAPAPPQAAVAQKPHPKIVDLPTSPITIVHVLSGGLPLCLFSTSTPSSWPPGQAWARTKNEIESIKLKSKGQVPCAGCLASDQYHNTPQM